MGLFVMVEQQLSADRVLSSFFQELVSVERKNNQRVFAAAFEASVHCRQGGLDCREMLMLHFKLRLITRPYLITMTRGETSVDVVPISPFQSTPLPQPRNMNTLRQALTRKHTHTHTHTTVRCFCLRKKKPAIPMPGRQNMYRPRGYSYANIRGDRESSVNQA